MYEMVTEKLYGLKIYEIKQIIFKLCYEPVTIFEKFDIEYNENEIPELKDMILEICREKGYLENFACNESKIYTFGIDIGIKNEIVRDILVEKAYDMIVRGSKDIEKTIKLFRTQNDGSEFAERRIIGGLKAMGFSNEEANYLYQTCNLFPLSLFLDRLDKTRISVVKEEYYKIVEKNNLFYIPENKVEVILGDNNSEEKENEEETLNEENNDTLLESVSENKTESEKEVQKEFSPATLVDNKELIEQLFKIKPEIKSKEELKVLFESATSEVERLQRVMSYVSKLEVEGIEFDELMQKEDKVISFFKAIDML